MTCITCLHWSLKSSTLRDMAPCVLGPIWTYWPPQHTCTKHRPAPPEAVEKRLARIEKKGR